MSNNGIFFGGVTLLKYESHKGQLVHEGHNYDAMWNDKAEDVRLYPSRIKVFKKQVKIITQKQIGTINK